MTHNHRTRLISQVNLVLIEVTAPEKKNVSFFSAVMQTHLLFTCNTRCYLHPESPSDSSANAPHPELKHPCRSILRLLETCPLCQMLRCLWVVEKCSLGAKLRPFNSLPFVMGLRGETSAVTRCTSSAPCSASVLTNQRLVSVETLMGLVCGHCASREHWTKQ